MLEPPRWVRRLAAWSGIPSIVGSVFDVGGAPLEPTDVTAARRSVRVAGWFSLIVGAALSVGWMLFAMWVTSDPMPPPDVANVGPVGRFVWAHFPLAAWVLAGFGLAFAVTGADLIRLRESARRAMIGLLWLGALGWAGFAVIWVSTMAAAAHNIPADEPPFSIAAAALVVFLAVWGVVLSASLMAAVYCAIDWLGRPLIRRACTTPPDLAAQ
jgi:hypothetical protein